MQQEHRPAHARQDALAAASSMHNQRTSQLRRHACCCCCCRLNYSPLPVCLQLRHHLLLRQVQQVADAPQLSGRVAGWHGDGVVWQGSVWQGAKAQEGGSKAQQGTSGESDANGHQHTALQQQATDSTCAKEVQLGRNHSVNQQAMRDVIIPHSNNTAVAAVWALPTYSTASLLLVLLILSSMQDMTLHAPLTS